MIPNQSIDMLTEAMSARHDGPFSRQSDPSTPEPLILFLGRECARAARVPDIENIAERALDLFGGDSDEGARYLPVVDRSNKADVLKALYTALDQVSGGLVYSMLQSLYLNIPVPLFYQDLALLVKAGYFNRIITTNFDTLLEQALNGAGMQAGFDYFVTSLGIKSDDSEDPLPVQSADVMPPDQESDEDREPVHIIKLHGDLAQQQINLSPMRIEKALRSQRRFVKSELKGDMLMVGYKFENKPINDWLASTGTTREQLWWVSSDRPERDINDWAAQVSFVDGEVGRPEAFFGQMVLRLLRQPVLESLNKSFKDYVADYGLNIEEESDEAEAQEVEETYGEKDPAVMELRDRIRHSQTVLFSHEQSFDAALRPPSVQTQIDYQKRQIARLEDKLREHPECRKRIIELVNLIASSVERVGDELKRKTLDFLQSQFLVVRDEYEQKEQQPNQQIISAALCTIVLLGDRIRVEMGEETIALESLRELASYVPSIAARGVI